MLGRHNLHEYQHQMIDFMKNTPRCAVFAGLGLGKSATTLTTIADIDDAQNILIVAPLRVANSVWAQEARLWSHLRDLDLVVATGSAAERTRALEKRARITVINQENIPWLVMNSKIPWRWDMLVYDESTGVKNSNSQRFKALKKITRYLKRVILLTATPLPNGMLDLWSQIYLIDGGERLGRTFGAYKTRFFVKSGYMGYGLDIIDGGKQEIMNRISDITLTLDVDDLLDMPERIDVTETIELKPALMKKYKQLENDFFYELSQEDGIEALSAAGLANKLLQFASGAMYDEDKTVHFIHDEKIKLLKELREANPNENLLVAYNFQFEKDLILKAFPEAVLLDKQGVAVDQWNNGKISMLLAHPASASMGLNLQKGGSVVIWYGLSWNLTNYLQFNGRLNRQGQTKRVRIVHLLTKGTLDEKVYAAIQAKAKTQSELLEHMKLFNAEF